MMSAATTAAARSTAARWLLSLLHLLRLLRVGLLQFLRLLLVSLLHLLRSFGSSMLFRQLLMLIVLLLLEFLPILGLPCDQLILLLLVFLVHLRVPRLSNSGAFDGRQLLRMGCKVGARSRGNCRRAVVRRKLLLGVIAGSVRMLSLSGYRPGMCLMSSSLFLSGGVRVDSAVTAVEADAVPRALVHPGVVNVVEVVGRPRDYTTCCRKNARGPSVRLHSHYRSNRSHS